MSFEMVVTNRSHYTAADVEQALERASLTEFGGDPRALFVRAHNDRMILAKEIERLRAVVVSDILSEVADGEERELE